MFAMEMGKRSDVHGPADVRRERLRRPRRRSPATPLIAGALVLGLLACVHVAAGALGGRVRTSAPLALADNVTGGAEAPASVAATPVAPTPVGGITPAAGATGPTGPTLATAMAPAQTAPATARNTKAGTPANKSTQTGKPAGGKSPAAPRSPTAAKSPAAAKSPTPAKSPTTPKSPVPPKSPPAQSSGQPFLTGIGDERTEMFTNPLWKQLHTTISRYIVPFDAVKHPWDMTISHQWIAAAEAAHQQILIAFYHSEYTPTKMPSVSEYTNDVKAYMKDFPHIKQYQPWNEANRGNEPHRYDSPTAIQSAEYYQALERLCHSCAIVGLDVLDQPNIAPTMRYIAEFKRDLGHLRVAMPTVWGLHNYSDTNRFQSFRTREIINALPGQIWVTETGGVVKFGTDFPNKNGSGLTRAARALAFTFKIAREHARIKRVYLFQWTGSPPSALFDAGLMNAHYQPRPGYVVVCRELHAAHCNVKTVNN